MVQVSRVSLKYGYDCIKIYFGFSSEYSGDHGGFSVSETQIRHLNT